HLVNSPRIDVNQESVACSTVLSWNTGQWGGQHSVEQIRLLLNHPLIDVNVMSRSHYPFQTPLSSICQTLKASSKWKTFHPEMREYQIFLLLLAHPDTDVNFIDAWGESPLSILISIDQS